MNENYTRSGTIRDVKVSLPELCVEAGAVNLYLYINSLNSYYTAFGTAVPEEVERAVDRMKRDQSINSHDFKLVTDRDTHTIFCIKVIRDYRTMLFRGRSLPGCPHRNWRNISKKSTVPMAISMWFRKTASQSMRRWRENWNAGRRRLSAEWLDAVLGKQ